MPNEVKVWDGTTWVLVSGSAGAAGERGARWYTGNGAPDVVPVDQWTPNGSTVQVGDFYLNRLTSEYSLLT